MNGTLNGSVPLAQPEIFHSQTTSALAGISLHSDVSMSEDRPTSKAESVSDPESDEGGWVTPTVDEQPGGKWLKGRHISVYWDGEQRWYDGVVLNYDADPTLIDSHGAFGPLHLVRYEDGDYEENLLNAVWKLAAADKVELETLREAERDHASLLGRTSHLSGQKRGRQPDKEQSKAALLSKARNEPDHSGIDAQRPSFLRTREDGEGKGSRIRKPSQKMKMAMNDFAYDTDDDGGGFKSEMVNLGHIIEGKKKRPYKRRIQKQFVGSESDDDFQKPAGTGAESGKQLGGRRRQGRSKSLSARAGERLLTSVSPLFVGCAVEVRQREGQAVRWVGGRVVREEESGKCEVLLEESMQKVVVEFQEFTATTPYLCPVRPEEHAGKGGCGYIVNASNDVRVQVGPWEGQRVWAGRHVRVLCADGQFHLGELVEAAGAESEEGGSEWRVHLAGREAETHTVPSLRVTLVPVRVSSKLRALLAERGVRLSSSGQLEPVAEAEDLQRGTAEKGSAARGRGGAVGGGAGEYGCQGEEEVVYAMMFGRGIPSRMKMGMQWRSCAVRGNPCREACSCGWGRVEGWEKLEGGSGGGEERKRGGGSSERVHGVQSAGGEASGKEGGAPDRARAGGGGAGGVGVLQEAEGGPTEEEAAGRGGAGGVGVGGEGGGDAKVPAQGAEAGGMGVEGVQAEVRGVVEDLLQAVAREEGGASGRAEARELAERGADTAEGDGAAETREGGREERKAAALEMGSGGGRGEKGGAGWRGWGQCWAGYRCCGVAFLRLKDMQSHWARRHEQGVVACRGGYDRPESLGRPRITGRGLRLVTALGEGEAAPEAFCARRDVPGLAELEPAHQKRVEVKVEVPAQRQGRGKGKGPGFMGCWLAGRSEEKAAAGVKEAARKREKPWEELLTAGWTFWGAEEDVDDDHVIR